MRCVGKVCQNSMNRVTLRLLAVCLLPRTGAASDLFVGNFFGNDSDFLQFNGTTGAFESVFVPHNSGTLAFPLGGASERTEISMSAIPITIESCVTIA